MVPLRGRASQGVSHGYLQPAAASLRRTAALFVGAGPSSGTCPAAGSQRGPQHDQDSSRQPARRPHLGRFCRAARRPRRPHVLVRGHAHGAGPGALRSRMESGVHALCPAQGAIRSSALGQCVLVCLVPEAGGQPAGTVVRPTASGAARKGCAALSAGGYGTARGPAPTIQNAGRYDR